jgi:hypothetical protein
VDKVRFLKYPPCFGDNFGLLKTGLKRFCFYRGKNEGLKTVYKTPAAAVESLIKVKKTVE